MKTKMKKMKKKKQTFSLLSTTSTKFLAHTKTKKRKKNFCASLLPKIYIFMLKWRPFATQFTRRRKTFTFSLTVSIQFLLAKLQATTKARRDDDDDAEIIEPTKESCSISIQTR